MTVPSRIVGAWRRSGLILDGVRQVDHADVLWLQTPDWFVDIRLRIDPSVEPPTGVPPWFFAEWAFAGLANWDPPVLSWHHLIDSSREPAMDANPLTWGDGVMFETGRTEVAGVGKVFVEEWLRMTDDDVQWDVQSRDHWARIELGRFAVEIADQRPTGAFMATRYHRGGSDWVPFGTVRA